MMNRKPLLSSLNKKYLLLATFSFILAFSFFTLGVSWNNYRNVNLSFGFNLNPPIDANGVKSEVLGVHVDAWVTRVGGEVEYLGHHVGVMTTIGFDNVQDALFDKDSTGYDAYYMSLTNSSSGPSSAWTIIPTELAIYGMDRAAGTYARTSATVCTLSHQWTCATAAIGNIKCVGFNWASSGDNNLMWADTFTPVSLQIGDKLTVTATITLSDT